MNAERGLATGEIFAAYIEWRATHPSDDIMTELLNVEFVDETGTTRRLTREELLIYLNVVAGAGNETTTRLIGWAGKVLAEHPDQRRELVDNPALIPQAIEELLRYEPPAPHTARYVTRDITCYDQTVPEGSVMMMLIGAACRDPRQFGSDSDEFNIHRPASSAPGLQRRHPLLSGLGVGAPGRPNRHRRDPQTLSGLGSRPARMPDSARRRRCEGGSRCRPGHHEAAMTRAKDCYRHFLPVDAGSLLKQSPTKQETAMPEYDYEQMKRDAEPLIKFEKDIKNRIAYITFDRPEAQNSTTLGMRQNYADLIHKCNVDDDVKVVVIRGEGARFR